MVLNPYLNQAVNKYIAEKKSQQNTQQQVVTPVTTPPKKTSGGGGSSYSPPPSSTSTSKSAPLPRGAAENIKKQVEAKKQLVQQVVLKQNLPDTVVKPIDTSKDTSLNISWETSSGESKKVVGTSTNILDIQRQIQSKGGRITTITDTSGKSFFSTPTTSEIITAEKKTYQKTKIIPNYVSSQVETPLELINQGLITDSQYKRLSYEASIGVKTQEQANKELNQIINQNRDVNWWKQYGEFKVEGKKVSWSDVKKREPDVYISKTDKGIKIYQDPVRWRKEKHDVAVKQKDYGYLIGEQIAPIFSPESWENVVKEFRGETYSYKSEDWQKIMLGGKTSKQVYEESQAKGVYEYSKAFERKDIVAIGARALSTPIPNIALGYGLGGAVGYGSKAVGGYVASRFPQVAGFAARNPIIARAVGVGVGGALVAPEVIDIGRTYQTNPNKAVLRGLNLTAMFGGMSVGYGAGVKAYAKRTPKSFLGSEGKVNPFVKKQVSKLERGVTQIYSKTGMQQKILQFKMRNLKLEKPVKFKRLETTSMNFMTSEGIVQFSQASDKSIYSISKSNFIKGGGQNEMWVYTKGKVKYRVFNKSIFKKLYKTKKFEFVSKTNEFNISSKASSDLIGTKTKSYEIPNKFKDVYWLSDKPTSESFSFSKSKGGTKRVPTKEGLLTIEQPTFDLSLSYSKSGKKIIQDTGVTLFPKSDSVLDLSGSVYKPTSRSNIFSGGGGQVSFPKMQYPKWSPSFPRMKTVTLSQLEGLEAGIIYSPQSFMKASFNAAVGFKTSNLFKYEPKTVKIQTSDLVKNYAVKELQFTSQLTKPVSITTTTTVPITTTTTVPITTTTTVPISTTITSSFTTQVYSIITPRPPRTITPVIPLITPVIPFGGLYGRGRTTGDFSSFGTKYKFRKVKVISPFKLKPVKGVF